MNNRVLCLGFCMDLNQFVIVQWGYALEKEKKRKIGGSPQDKFGFGRKQNLKTGATYRFLSLEMRLCVEPS